MEEACGQDRICLPRGARLRCPNFAWENGLIFICSAMDAQALLDLQNECPPGGSTVTRDGDFLVIRVTTFGQTLVDMPDLWDWTKGQTRATLINLEIEVVDGVLVLRVDENTRASQTLGTQCMVCRGEC